MAAPLKVGDTVIYTDGNGVVYTGVKIAKIHLEDFPPYCVYWLRPYLGLVDRFARCCCPPTPPSLLANALSSSAPKSSAV